MRIVLVQPAKVPDASLASDHWQLCRPYSLLYLQAALDKQGHHTCSICDLERLYVDDPSLDLDEIVKALEADAFGVTSSTFTRFEALNTIKKIRFYHPGAPIIVGGVHFMNCDIDTLKNCPEVDYVIRGEGETVLVSLLDALEFNKPLFDVGSITFRDTAGGICRTVGQSIFEDLDSLEVYKYKSPLEYPELLFGATHEIPATSIMTSRGCPYHCIFCAKSGMRYRHRSPESVIQEILYYKDKFNISAFNFLDLTFTASPKRAKELCQVMIDTQLDIVWWCETRADIPLDLLDIMSKAGCRYLVVGVESGSEKVLSHIQKGINLEQVFNLIEEAKRVGIEPSCYFMLSHLGETIDNALDTVNYIGKLFSKYGVMSALQPCMILPGATLESLARERGIIPPNFSWVLPYSFDDNIKVGQVANIPLFLDQMTIEDIALVMNEYQEIMKSFAFLKDAPSIKKEKIARYLSGFNPNRFWYLIKKHGVRGLLNLMLRDIVEMHENRDREKAAKNKVLSIINQNRTK